MILKFLSEITILFIINSQGYVTLEKHKICIELFVKKYNNNLRLFVNKFLSLTSQVFNFFFLIIY